MTPEQLDGYEWRRRREREAAEEKRKAAATDEFLAACQGRPSADVTNLQWLAALLTDLRDTDWAENTPDREASWEALAQSEALLLGLREAVAKARGE